MGKQTLVLHKTPLNKLKKVNNFVQTTKPLAGRREERCKVSPPARQTWRSAFGRQAFIQISRLLLPFWIIQNRSRQLARAKKYNRKEEEEEKKRFKLRLREVAINHAEERSVLLVVVVASFVVLIYVGWRRRRRRRQNGKLATAAAAAAIYV